MPRSSANFRLDNHSKESPSISWFNLCCYPRTYVITLDSLGGPHKQAVNQLTKYLKLEAKDKKGIEQPTSATGLVAAVGTNQYALLVLR
jgi:hypothetical protein